MSLYLKKLLLSSTNLFHINQFTCNWLKVEHATSHRTKFNNSDTDSSSSSITKLLSVRSLCSRRRARLRKRHTPTTRSGITGLQFRKSTEHRGGWERVTGVELRFEFIDVSWLVKSFAAYSMHVVYNLNLSCRHWYNGHFIYDLFLVFLRLVLWCDFLVDFSEFWKTFCINF